MGWASGNGEQEWVDGAGIGTRRLNAHLTCTGVAVSVVYFIPSYVSVGAGGLDVTNLALRELS
jgi:hypothetical protein